jgi:hypothetical protein
MDKAMAELQALKEQIRLVERYLTAMRADLDSRPKMSPEGQAQAEYEIATMTGVLETLKRLMPDF